MPDVGDLLRERAPQVLGGIRLFYGTSSLLAPSFIARRLGVDPDANPAPIHPLRMFGIRTVLIGAELLFQGSRARARAMRVAPLIHASDTASALISGLKRQLPPRVAVATTLVSGMNTALALVGQPPRSPRARARRRLKALKRR